MSESDIDAPEWVGETDSKREWECPDCGHKRPRHHLKKTRPFCAPCEWREAVLVEMVPIKHGEKVDLPR